MGISGLFSVVFCNCKPVQSTSALKRVFKTNTTKLDSKQNITEFPIFWTWETVLVLAPVTTTQGVQLNGNNAKWFCTVPKSVSKYDWLGQMEMSCKRWKFHVMFTFCSFLLHLIQTAEFFCSNARPSSLVFEPMRDQLFGPASWAKFYYLMKTMK